MIRKILLFVLFFMGSTAFCTAGEKRPDFDFSSPELTDQYEQAVPNPEQVRWVLLVPNKTAHKQVHHELDQQGDAWLKEKKMIVMVDISGMPSLITKFIALPKMRNYRYKIYLDRDEHWVSHWAQELSVVEIVDGHPGKVQTIHNFAQLRSLVD